MPKVLISTAHRRYYMTVISINLNRGTSKSNIFEEIYEYVQGLEIIDTHEHLPAFENLRDKKTDVLKEYLTHYFNCDLISAGLCTSDFEKVINTDLPLVDRWDIVEPYWDFSMHTGYARALDISVKGLYGIDRICRETIEELNNKFLDSLKPEHFKKVLKDKSKIRISLLHDIPKVNDKIVFDSNLKCDQSFFRNVYPIDGLIFPQTGDEIERIEKQAGFKICGFGDYIDACQSLLDNALKHGAVALKSALAYQRSIFYERVTRSEAEQEFNELFKYKHMGNYLPSVFPLGRNFQDYMMHFILRLAGRRNLTVQFHTGIQEGNGNILKNSDPALLSNLFLEHPDVDFDIFHMGYPFQDVVSVLAKNFPNVFIDMCWAHIISPAASIKALAEWIDSVPVNKISAFGGDYIFIDGVYGHQFLARQNVSRALAVKVDEGMMDVDRAKEISRMLFYKNPYSIFKLEGKL